MMYALSNQGVPLFEVFKHHMFNDKRIQYSLKDYYYEMISIYEIFLTSKFLTMLYDNYFRFLRNDKINEINIPESIFVNPLDRKKFSERQILINIRNAFNHNDNPNHELVKFIRVNENGKDAIKVEIMLKNTEPIPFHVIIDTEQLISICFEIENSNTILIASNRSTKPISINSSNVGEMLDCMFLRKFYSRKKLSDEQIDVITNHLNNNQETRNNESFLLDNGMEYRDYRYSIAQKLKVEEDMKYWESIGISGNDIIGHLLGKVMPLSYSKDRTFTMNLIFADYYMRDGKKTIFDLVKDAREVLNTKKTNLESPLHLYAKSFGIDSKILYDAIDFENLYSLTSAVYYGFIFDSLVTNEEIQINDKKTVTRKKIRDSFVHMRWFKGINECFKLFDWENGIDNEYNKESNGFWQTNVKLVDMERCAENYFQSSIFNRNPSYGYMNLPIHFRKETNEKGESKVTSITFIKNEVFFYLDLTNRENKYNLLVCDETQIQRTANEKEKMIFVKELDNLTELEKNEFSEIIEKIKNELMLISKNVVIKK